MKLDKTPEGSRCVLKKIEGTRNFMDRTRSIGLAEEAHFQVIRNQKKMPVLIYCRDTLLAVNRKDAAGIEVEVTGR